MVVNIIADVIIEITKGIREYLTDDGIFIASGIILDRIDDVEKAIKGLGLLYRNKDNGRVGSGGESQ